MKYSSVVCGIFLDRPNRFIAHVNIDGVVHTVHVKNTGRCRELLISGVKVILALSNNPSRKTKYDLIAVYKKGVGLINIDSQAPNAIVMEWLQSGKSCFGSIDYIRPEYTYGNSRFDFYIQIGARQIFIEVKGCTLEIDGVGYFPDAPTLRGVKHLNELSHATLDGYECYVVFTVTVPGVTEVFANRQTHPEFGKALDSAILNGVTKLVLPCDVTENEVKIII